MYYRTVTKHLRTILSHENIIRTPLFRFTQNMSHYRFTSLSCDQFYVRCFHFHLQCYKQLD